MTVNSGSAKLKTVLVRKLFFVKSNEPLSDFEWEILLRQARAAGVISRLAKFYKKFNYFNATACVVKHFDAADTYWDSQKQIVDWELHHLETVFNRLRLPLILLKGTAYMASNLIAGDGRVFSDVDILVAEERLQEVKNRLIWSGWFPEPLDSYDQQYYRRWMHELPPMRHAQRGTSLDVHHNILPKTCASHPDAKKLIERAVRIPDSNLWTLSREDMVIHSACHLFFGGEFENGLRDISDLDLLLREFATGDADFWRNLLVRADELGLEQPLFYALRYTAKILETPVPEEILRQSLLLSSGRIKEKLMDFLFLRAFMPGHPSCDDRWTGLARWLLYMRSHWLKMPWYLLLFHLGRKSFFRMIGKEHN
jgi:hypothetical protein